MFGWIGTITGIIGGLLLALNISISHFGFLFFLTSASSWIIQGLKNKDKALILLNVFFIFIDLIGIYRWFF
ncbi:hypothetical protein MNB_SUP05-5-1100 [hydrothermal vent metagenome]|uniref:Uncharacterized protein n=1 Tax=hydrothermal vent metagenome TaxID=652676 RepID=A0A1W1BYV5_9ZZZZ